MNIQEDVITDAIDDSKMEDVMNEQVEAGVDAGVKVEAEADTQVDAPADDGVVASPAAKADIQATDSVEDEFAKKHGLAPQRPGERENRIPYSAVKRIVSNAEKKALEPVQTRLTEYEGKVTDYEARLTKVAQFEQVLANDPVQFLNRLATIPAYRQIFDQMSKGSASGANPVGQAQTATPGPTGRPEPDVTLSDGSKVYSLEGLDARDKWNREQAKLEAIAEFGKRMKPFEDERAFRQREAELRPIVDGQIEQARKWTQFTENETAIVAALQANRTLSLEGAYLQVVVPKLVADQNTIRAKVMADLKKAPTSTSTVTSASKPGIQSKDPKSTEDLIWDTLERKGLATRVSE